MTTRKIVVADDLFRTIQDRRWELESRIRKGTLDPQKVADHLQFMIEHCGWNSFPQWNTITHGGKRDAASYRKARSISQTKASTWSDQLLDCFSTASVDEEVVLACASVEELGFRKPTEFKVICQRIVDLGFFLCLPEDGPVLREQYTEQPEDSKVYLAMEAIRDLERKMCIFSVFRNHNGLWLGGVECYPATRFDREERFVFRIRKRPFAARG